MRSTAARRCPTAQASLQLVWTGVALVFFLVVLLVVRDHTVLQSYAYTLALVGVLFLAIPAVLPASLSEVNGAQIWIKVPGLFSIQPAEFAKIALIIFAAAYLVPKRTVLSTAGKKIFGLVLPRARDLGPLIVALLLALLVLVRGKDLGTALLLFGTLLAMIYVATGRVSWLIIGVLGFAGGAYLAYRLFSHVRAQGGHLARPVRRPAGRRATSWCSRCSGSAPAASSAPAWVPARPDIVPFASTDFIIAALGEELGLFGLTAILLLLPAADRPRASGPAWPPGTLRQAARRRARVLPGPAGVRHRRRRHQADPADRADHAVPVLRRLVAAGQLRHPGAAGADLRLLATAAEPAAPRPVTRDAAGRGAHPDGAVLSRPAPMHGAAEATGDQAVNARCAGSAPP